MNRGRGGIFSGPNALGLGATGSSCQPDNPTVIKQVQAYLQKTGCPQIKVDGQWQGCTASAFNKVFGHPYVTQADMEKMGIQCSSDDYVPGLMGPWLPGFSFAAINTCTDKSDGCGTGGAQCPSGQTWNAQIGACLPTEIPVLPQPQDNNQPASGSCPAGQMNVPLLGCVTNPIGGNTQAQYCPDGYTNVGGQCVGAGGVQPATECPTGQKKFLGVCVPDLLGGGGASTTSSGACPAGQMGVPPFCVPNPFSSDKGGSQPSGGGLTDLMNTITTTIGGLFGQGENCPAGSVFDPVSKQCMTASGPVPAIPGGGVTPSAGGDGVFGSMKYVIGGLLVVGGLAGAYWWYNKRQQEEMFAAGMDPSMMDPMMDPSMMGMDEFGGMGFDDMYGMDPTFMYPNRKRRGKKSRRRSRKGRGRRCR